MRLKIEIPYDRKRDDSPVRRDDVFQIGVGQIGQNEIVDFIERIGRKGDIPAPVQIIKDIRHNCLPFYSNYIF